VIVMGASNQRKRKRNEKKGHIRAGRGKEKESMVRETVVSL